MNLLLKTSILIALLLAPVASRSANTNDVVTLDLALQPISDSHDRGESPHRIPPYHLTCVIDFSSLDVYINGNSDLTDISVYEVSSPDGSVTHTFYDKSEFVNNLLFMEAGEYKLKFTTSKAILIGYISL